MCIQVIEHYCLPIVLGKSLLAQAEMLVVFVPDEIISQGAFWDGRRRRYDL